MQTPPSRKRPAGPPPIRSIIRPLSRARFGAAPAIMQVAPVVGLPPVYGRAGYKRTYPRSVRVGPLFRKKVKKVVNEDSENKYSSVDSYRADIVVADGKSGHWHNYFGNTAVKGIRDATVVVNSTDTGTPNSAQVFSADTADRTVLLGDYNVAQREGAEIYPQRLDLFITPSFPRGVTVPNPKWVKVRIWVVQAKRSTISTDRPTWNMWQPESKSGEISYEWTKKTPGFFDNRISVFTPGKDKFRVLKKIVYKFKNRTLMSTHSLNDWISNVDGGSSINPTSLPPADQCDYFKTINLKTCQSVRYRDTDATGASTPDNGNLFLMCQMWSDIASSANWAAVAVSVFGRTVWKEDPAC